MRSLAVGLAAFALTFVLATSSCGGAPKACTPASCKAGCCDEDGECLAGTGLFDCGVSGAKCQRCAVTETCRVGACELLGDGGVYDGGLPGSGGGSGVGGGVGGGSAAGGGSGGGGGAMDAGRDGGADAGRSDAGLDAGKPDGGTDGGTDGGKSDAGTDAGKGDAGADAGRDGGDAGDGG